MLIKNINLLQNLIVAGLLTLVSGDCTKQVFFLENSAYQPQKGDTRIRNLDIIGNTMLYLMDMVMKFMKS